MSTVTTTSPSATSSPLKRLISGHPLVAFFVIAFAGEWIVTLPLVLGQNGLGLFPYTIPEIGLVPLAYWFSVLASIAGPTLASFTVTAVTTGKPGVRQLLRRYVLWRVGVRWYLLVIAGVPLIQLAFASIFSAGAPLVALLQHWPLFFTVYLPNILIISVAIQIWEEGGWSGFAVPNLQKRFGAWRACLVLGPLWALFHLPFFIVPGQIFQSKVGVSTMVVYMVLLSPVPEATVDWPPTLERWWLLFFGDHSVQSRRSGEGHLPADLLKCLRPDGCLEMLRRLPLSNIDEAKPGLWVQALMKSSREEARCLPEVLSCCVPSLEERFLLALGDLKRINQNNSRHDVYPFLGSTAFSTAMNVFPHRRNSPGGHLFSGETWLGPFLLTR